MLMVQDTGTCRYHMKNWEYRTFDVSTTFSTAQKIYLQFNHSIKCAIAAVSYLAGQLFFPAQYNLLPLLSA